MMEAEERICINPDCEWTGKVEDTVHPKNSPEELLCPKCHEVTEEATICLLTK